MKIREYKKCYRKILDTDIHVEIYYTLLYQGKLYCACRKKESEDRILIHFQMEKKQEIKALSIEKSEELEWVIECCEEMYCSDDRGLFSGIPHFLYLSDTKELVPGSRILENNLEYFLNARLEKIIPTAGPLVSKFLFAGFFVCMLFCLIVTVSTAAEHLNYRQHNLDDYALPVEHNYSYIKERGGKQGKLVLTVNEEGIVSLPCRENGIPLVRSGEEAFDVGDGLVFTASLQMKNGTTTQAYEGAYNEESDAVEIYVPELETDYGYGVLVVTATNGQESTQTRVTVEESRND